MGIQRTEPTGEYLGIEIQPPRDDGGGQHDHHHGVREFVYRDHRVRIRTTYEIEIDGERWGGDVHAAPDGSVHYMGMPQYATGSAVDLVQRVIDLGHEGQRRRRRTGDREDGPTQGAS